MLLDLYVKNSLPFLPYTALLCSYENVHLNMYFMNKPIYELNRIPSGKKNILSSTTVSEL